MSVTPLQIIFVLVSGLILSSALMVVTSRRMLHAALWLVLTLFGVAAVFAILQAGFFAVAQVIIYIGAIAILVIFAVMLTRRVMDDRGPQQNELWWASAAAALAVFIGLVLILLRWVPFREPVEELAAPSEAVPLLGQALVSPGGYVLPFEVASILLLAALIGAIYIGWERKPAGSRRSPDRRDA